MSEYSVSLFKNNVDESHIINFTANNRRTSARKLMWFFQDFFFVFFNKAKKKSVFIQRK